MLTAAHLLLPSITEPWVFTKLGPQAMINAAIIAGLCPQQVTMLQHPVMTIAVPRFRILIGRIYTTFYRWGVRVHDKSGLRQCK